MGFDLLRKPKDYRTFVRRRLRFACLWRFFDLWQSVKKEFFDRLKNAAAQSRGIPILFDSNVQMVFHNTGLAMLNRNGIGKINGAPLLGNAGLDAFGANAQQQRTKIHLIQ